MTADDVRALLKNACDKDGSMRAWAKRCGVSAAYVSDVLLRRREPGPSILEPLGLEAKVVYEVSYQRKRKSA